VVDQTPILADVDISPKILKRTFEGIPVVSQPQAAKLSPDKVTITVEGPWPQVKSLENKDLKAIVPTGNLSSGRHRLKVDVLLPDGLTLESVTPQSLVARVEKK
jgi:YbbR domain-containing protein